MSGAMEIVGRDLVWVGESAPIQWIKTQLKEVAETDLPITMIGEPGSGRRLAARTVHALGARKDHPFIEVNCGTLHEALADSVLFGQKGASPKKGAFAQAEEGTIFLEEIEGLPKASQEHLLRALKKKRIEGKGGKQPLTFDVRVIAATGQDLDRMVKIGVFCAELYYRLSIVPVKLPPLRERRKDIPLLAAHFVSQCAASMGREPPHLSLETTKALLAYDWPGNVWELKRTLERAVVLGGEEEIRPQHVKSPFAADRMTGDQNEKSALFNLQPVSPRHRSNLN